MVVIEFLQPAYNRSVKRGVKMIQRLLLLTATLLALFCESAYGLGLGDLELKSALNQEFSAEIKLTNTEGLAIEEVLPNLASQEDFDRVGVDRNYLLVDLRFRVRVEADGSMVVIVTSNRPIIEPFLNFIVEILWPTGRILREYTVLLDPPVFANQGAAPISPTTSSSAAGPSSGSAVESKRRPIPEYKGSTPTSSADEYGMTGAGDTLWSIATDVRLEGVSMQQTMLALQKANPEAFISNNINLLKAGHVLRIPDRDEILAASNSEAVAEVQIQNEEFEEYKTTGVAQMDATRRTAPSSSPEPASDDGELRLLAADSSSGQRAGDSDARNEALSNEIAVAREDLDRSRRANSELNVRMDDLSGQLETLNEIVKLKDDQLAALRAQVQKSMETSDKPTPVAPAAPSQSMLSNPLVLGGLGIFLVIVVVLVLVMMRRRQQGSDLSDDGFAEVSIDEVDSGSEETAIQVDPEPADDAVESEEDVEQQTSDAISEAEIYIAYGRFPQAITFLLNAIEKEPSRADIQLKLLEVYVQTEDATAFNLQLDQLKTLGDDDAISTAEGLQSQIPGASESAEAAMEATIISTEPVIAIEEPDDDDDFSFDLDDLDSETEDDDLGLGDELDLDDAEEMELDLDLDADDEITLELDGDQDATLELESGVESAGDDELELSLDDDLELDLDLDLDFEDESESLEIKEDDAELDLGDDLDLDDDVFTLDLDDDEEINLEDDLDAESEDDGAISLDLDDDGEIDFGEDDELDLGDDDEIELDLEGDLDLGDDELELDLGDDDLELDLGDDDLELDLDDDPGELNLDDDADSKLDLARAYVEMGSNDEARAKLQEVIAEGSEAEAKEASELLEKLD
jgi:pilus assembly protein FimV